MKAVCTIPSPHPLLSFLLQAHVSSSCTLLNPRGLPWAFSRDVLLTTGWMCDQETAAVPAGDVPMPVLVLPDHHPDAVSTNWWQKCCWLQRNVKTCQYWVLFQVSRKECAVLVTGCSSSAYPLQASLTPSAPAVSNPSASLSLPPPHTFYPWMNLMQSGMLMKIFPFPPCFSVPTGEMSKAEDWEAFSLCSMAPKEHWNMVLQRKSCSDVDLWSKHGLLSVWGAPCTR